MECQSVLKMLVHACYIFSCLKSLDFSVLNNSPFWFCVGLGFLVGWFLVLLGFFSINNNI